MVESPTHDETELLDIQAMVAESHAVLEAKFGQLDDRVAYAAGLLVEMCHGQFPIHIEEIADLSADMDSTLAVLQLVADKADDRVVRGACRLFEIAKQRLDDLVDQTT